MSKNSTKFWNGSLSVKGAEGVMGKNISRQTLLRVLLICDEYSFTDDNVK